MSQKESGPPPIVYIVVFLALFGGGYWWFFKRGADTPTVPASLEPVRESANTNAAPQADSASSPPDSASSSQADAITNFPAPTTVPSGTIVRLDGSTSMVTLNANLKAGFEAQFPGTQVMAEAKGSARGIEALVTGEVDVAASSRLLKPEEANLGLVAVPVAFDRIAIVVGAGNTSQSLTTRQVVDIFQGRITNWSEVGGSNLPIRVLNRPPQSGTHQTFKEVVLGGGEFGSGSTITTLERDATTPMLQQLGNDGVGYATASQVINQTTVRVVAIDGITPVVDNYPFSRQLYYVYRNPASAAATAFLGYALSPQGQQQMFATP